MSALFARLVASVRDVADRLARQAATEHLMVFSLPDGTAIRLGGPLTVAIPESLRSGRHADLHAMVSRLEMCVPGRPSLGAEDWADFGQRMHVIMHVFCGFNERADLFSSPFTTQQIQEILSGRVPEGSL